MKNLSKEMKAIYAVCLLGVILIVFGSVKLVFFGDKNVDDGNDIVNEDSGNNELLLDNNDKLLNYIDLATSSIDLVKSKVEEYDFINDDALYLLPVGNGKCVDSDSLKKSPYSDTWEYFYVGVTHSDMGYEYFVVALDSSGMGIDFRPEFELYADQEYLVVDSSRLTVFGIKDIYSNNKDVTYSNNLGDGYLSIDELEGGSDFALVSSKEKIVFVSKCS